MKIDDNLFIDMLYLQLVQYYQFVVNCSILKHVLNFNIYLADPGKARGCSMNSLVINSFIHSLIKSFILFLPQLYGAATPKRLEIELPVIK